MQTGMVNFYVDLRRERSIQPVTVFFPDGTDNEYKDNEIASYIMLPANGREDQILWKTIENECKEKPVKYDQQMHQTYRKKIRYDVESDQLKIESKNGTITMFDLKVQNKGKKITGKYSFRTDRTDDGDNGKVTMTRLKG